MKRSDFTFNLPETLIAQYPPENRGDSRLLCLDRRSGKHRDQAFADIQTELSAGDLLVFNNTRVVPARLFGRKESGGKVEILLERLMGKDAMLCQVRASKTPRLDSILVLEDDSRLRVCGREKEFFVLRLEEPAALVEKLEQLGHVPLPPYITRQDDARDKERYQTVYAEHPGAVAAPTAGLHFSSEMIEDLKSRGIQTGFVTLHVAAGTFQPVRAEDVEEHHMHSEWYQVTEELCQQVSQTRDEGGRVIAIGTTAVRCLESAAANGELCPFEGDTDIFIYPGYEFRVVDALLTNFHLPESTLLMLVSAFAGRENVLNAYRHAVEEHYRFFSYGDAMFIS